jgi:ADP-heptose:LPS heptosyltransferase
MNDPGAGQDAKSILMVFLHGLGDNVMFTGPLREYHKLHPSHRISLLILNNGSPEVWRNNPRIHEVFTSRSGRNPHYWDPARYWRKDFWELRREVRHVCEQRHFDRIIHVSIAMMPELFYRLTRSYGPHKTWRIARDLGIPPKNLTPEIFLELDQAGAEEFVRQNQLCQYAVLHPFSRYVRRGVGVESIQRIIEVLRGRGLQVVLAGRSREIAALKLEHVIPAIDLPLNRLLAIIARAGIFLGTESGIAHLAGLVAKRMVVLSTRTKALRLTNCGPLAWGMPYSAVPVKVVEMSRPVSEIEMRLGNVLRTEVK